MKLKKILVLAVPMLLFGGVTSAVVAQPQVGVVAAASSETEEVENKWNNFKDTFLIPILSGVSITSIVALCTSVLMAYVNNRRNKNATQKVLELIASINSFAVSAQKIASEFKETKEVSETTLKAFELFSKETLQKFDELEKDRKELESLKGVIVQFSEVIEQLTRVNKDAITSGAAKAIFELNEKISKLKE